MRRIHLLVAPLPFLLPALSLGACGNDSARVALALSTPKQLLDGASAQLRVIPAGNATCNQATGFIDPASPGDAQEFPLASDCEPAADGRTPVLCAEITLDQDGEERVFEILATRGGETVARGCTVTAVDQDPLEVAITVQANLPPKCCNDGIIQVGEQCDTALAAPDFCGQPNEAPIAGSCTGVFTDDVCECDCLAREILLSQPDLDAVPGLSNDPGSKGEVAIAFAGGGGDGDVPNSLRAVFTDFTQYTGNNSGVDINQRLLSDDLYTPETPLFQQQLRLLPTCIGDNLDNEFGKSLTQQSPAISRVDDENLAVAFLDDSDIGNPQGDFNVHVIQLNRFGCGEDLDLKVNVAKTTSLANPAVGGGPDGSALVVWADGSALRGRIWSTGATTGCMGCLPAMSDLDLGEISAGTKPHVAGNADGWVVTYNAPGTDQDVFMRTVDPTGALGEATIVNLIAPGPQTEPDIAMLEDGRFAIVWMDAGFAMFQRFEASGSAVAGDQDAPLTVSAPAGAQPSIAAGNDAGGFFAAIWSTPGDGALWGRYIGAGAERFLRNSVTGTFSDFLASHPVVPGTRSGPDVAVGGAGFVAIAWNDPNGIFVRRFPLPSALQL